MEYLVDLVLLFFIYSFVGWIIEVVGKLIQFGRFINRGFLTGPWLPIYGTGAALITLSVFGIAGLESSIGTTFIISFFVCGIVEYMTSLVMEKRFHARWWDYSQKPMNLHGRVWIGNLILFGLGGVIIIAVANPLFYELLHHISVRGRAITAGVLTLAFLSDYIFSHFVMKLVRIGVETSDADDTEAMKKELHKLFEDRNYFYKRFVDAYPDVVYYTEKIEARKEEIRLETERARKQAEQWMEEYNQWMVEKKKQFMETIDPIGTEKNKMIANQEKLIALLYDENSATEEEQTLMNEILYSRSKIEKH